MKSLPPQMLVHLLLQLTVLLAVAHVLGQVTRRMGVTSLVGQVSAGLLLGPSVLGHWFPDLQRLIFPYDQNQANLLSAICSIGLLLYLFVCGLEVNLGLIQKKGRQCLTVSMGGLTLPLIGGYLLGQSLPDSFLSAPGSRLPLALFLAVAMSVSSLTAITTLFRETGTTKQAIAQLTIGATMVDDIVAWVSIAVIAQLYASGRFDALLAGRSVLTAIAFIVFIFTVGRWLLRRVLILSNKLSPDASAQVAFMVITAICVSLLTDQIGLAVELGAFVAGIVLGSLSELRAATVHALTITVASFLLPLYFGLSGLRLDLWTLFSAESALWLGAIIAVATVCKAGGVYLGSWLNRQPTGESVMMSLAMNSRGGTEIVIASMGLSIGLLSQQIYAMIVIMAVATVLLSVPAAAWALKRCKPDELPEDPAALAFIHDSARGHPGIAFGLIEQEQLRLARRLVGYCDALRTDSDATISAAAMKLYAPFTSVASGTESFMRSMMGRYMIDKEVERLTLLQSRLAMLVGLNQCLNSLCLTTSSVVRGGTVAQTRLTFVDSIDFLLGMMVEASVSENDELLVAFLNATSERSGLLEKIRDHYAAEDNGLTKSEKAILFDLTGSFQQMLWLSHQMAKLMILGREHGQTGEVTGSSVLQAS